ncbi:plasmid transfer protein TraA [Streptantibioticus silvisoli]|uniref:Plasmid transfer protein TraA n=1 Tax=Streptantibioticus silvisoli TaxID=2705255 RepID=A0ABT6W9U2_9ACTN|nr:plasmid transfer protein TraA [Streptantibioticus silvisoli]MDI5967150.1 plasmid transfer protein TraA [Streptantibioticus silvisoli]
MAGQFIDPPKISKQHAVPNRAAETNAFLLRLAQEAPQQPGPAPAPVGRGRENSIPGSSFATDDDIRAWCEAVRKDSRTAATERSMDADLLESVLKTIPDTTGSRQGSRARARRVSRWAKKIAAAEKAKQKYAATLYGTFVREYETELARVSAGRPKQPARRTFQFGR